MDKRFVVIGIVLLVIGVGIWAGSNASYVVLQRRLLAGTTVMTINMTAARESIATYRLNLSGAYLTTFIYTLTPDANLYMFNASAYGRWREAIASGNASDLAAASALEGHGAIIVARNVSAGTYGNATAYSSYFNPKRPANETYYVVIDNTGSSASSNDIINATLLYTATPLAALSVFVSGSSAISLDAVLPGMVIVIAALVLMVYGAIKKRKTDNGDAQVPILSGKALTNEYVDELYKGVEAKRRQRRRRPKRSVNK